jgi:large repetitive protein
LNAGNYNTITVASFSCTSPAVGPITLVDPTPPVAPGASGVSPVCSGQTLVLQSSGLLGATYHWTGPNGLDTTLIATTLNLVNSTAAMTGTYSVTQTKNNCTSPATLLTMVVNQTPIISKVVRTNPTGCGFCDGKLTLVLGTPGQSFTISYNGPGGITTANLTSDTAGKITLSGLCIGVYTGITATRNNCTSLPIGADTLFNPAPPATPIPTASNPVCTGGTLSLFANGILGATFSWNGPNGFTSIQPSPAISGVALTHNGNYCVTQTYNGCTSAQGCVNVTVNQTPTITSFTSTNPTKCAASDGTITLSGLNFNTAYVTNYNGPSGSVTRNDTSNGVGQITIKGLSSGIYNNITVGTGSCTSAGVGALFLVDPTSPAIPSLTGTTTVCVGSTISLTASGAPTATFEWVGPNSFVGTGSTISRSPATNAMSGTYAVTQTVNGCKSSPTVVNVTINPLPSLSLSTSNDTVCLGQTVQLVTIYDFQTIGINWFKGNNTTPIASGLLPITVTPTGGDNMYHIVGTNIYGCLNRDTVWVHRNLNPTANADTIKTCEDVITEFDPTNNDTDPEHNKGKVTIIKAPKIGTAVVNSNQTITYTSFFNQNGLDTLVYMICDKQCLNQCDTNTVYFYVCAVNDPPTADNINVFTNKNVPVGVNVSSATGDPDGDPLNFYYGVPSVLGTTVTTTSIGAIVVTPPANFIGTITIPYSVCDITNVLPQPLCDTALITVTVYPDVIPNLPPVAKNDYTSTPKNMPTTLIVKANDHDPNGDSTLTNPVILSTTKHGTSTVTSTGTVTYIPANKFIGYDTFTYKICDNGTPSLCDTAIGVIFVSGDTTVTPNQPPVAVDDHTTTTEDVPVRINVRGNDSDPDGNNLTIPNIISTTKNGTSTLNTTTGIITYVPNKNFFGTDTFTYVICDDGIPSLCDTAISVIYINPINDAPIAVNDTVTVKEDGSKTITVMANDSDPDGNPIVVTAVGQPVNGTIVLNPNGTVTYTPNPNFHGTDVFTYTICDVTTIDPHPLCSQANVYINVTPVNDPPVAHNDIATTSINTNVLVVVQNNDSDPDNNPLATTQILTAPVNGTATINANGTVTYAPSSNFSGIDSFEYVIEDITTVNPQPLQSTAWVYVTVNGTVCAVIPVANDDYVSTTKNTLVTINATNNDSPAASVVAFTSSPAHGSVTINGGNINYTPATGYTGADAFVYTISASAGCFDTAIVFINVMPSVNNNPPVANNDNVQTGKNQSVIVSVQLNDNDPDGNSITTSIPSGLTPPTQGTVTVNSNGTVTYVPTNGFTGTDSFQYRICDNGIPSLCDTAMVYVLITATPINHAPIANTDDTTTYNNQPVTIAVLNDDTDPDTDPIHTSSVVTAPTHGTAVLNSNGTITYTPTNGYTGLDSFVYEIKDTSAYLPHVLSSQAWVYVNVISNNLNHPPLAVNDTTSTPEATPVVITVLNNDSDPDGNNTIHVTNISQPVNGTAVLNPNGTVTYTPNAGFYGTDVFTYTICDNGIPVMCSQANVYINVTPVNNPPVANTDVVTTSVNTTVKVTVQSNDNDPDNNPLVTSAIVTTPAHGTTVINPNGTIDYTPSANYTGLDSFEYRICDSTIVAPHPLCATAKVYVTVTGTVCAVIPNANYDVAITNANQMVSVAVTTNDIPATGTIQNVSSPMHGTVVINGNVIEYTPSANYSGNDQFIYTLGANASCFDTAIVMISVQPSIVNHPPVANNDNVKTAMNNSVIVSVQLNDKDIDGDLLTTSLPSGLTTPNHGTVNVNPNSKDVTYLPYPGFTGTDSFQYVICDNGIPSLCDTAMVYVIIDPTKANNPPVANNDDTTTTNNQSVTIHVLNNDTDPDSDPIHTVGVTTPATNGSVVLVGNNFVYTPNSNYVGMDSFQYVINDTSVYAPHVLSSTAWVHILVTNYNKNNPPVAVNDTTTTLQDTPVAITVMNNDSDPDGDVITVTQFTQANNGSVSNVGGVLTYTPNTGFVGTDVFTYTICDNGNPSLCDIATVYVTVNPVNHAPVANNDVVTVTSTSSVVNVQGNDSDPDGNPIITDSIMTQPLHGTVVINSGNTITYIPNGTFSGTDSFQYQIHDVTSVNPQPLTATAWVYVTVVNCTTPPTALNDTALNISGATSIKVLANDKGLTLTTTFVSAPQHGTASIDASGAVIYTPAAGFSGADHFDYTVCSAAGCCATASVYVTVAPFNHPPVANNDITATAKNQSQLISVMINDNDPDNNPIHVTNTTSPIHGTVTVGTNNTIIYTPNANYTGLDSFTYTICDTSALLPHVLCDVATVYVLVKDSLHNNPPVANVDIAVTTMNTAVTVNQIANDNDPDFNPIHTTTILGTPNHGAAVLNANGTITYTPIPGFVGMDTIQYIINDTSLLTPNVLADTGFVIITVNPAPPLVANPDYAVTVEEVPVTIDILNNDVTSNLATSTTLTVMPNNGTVVLNTNGTITYTPNAGFNGKDTMIYTLCYQSTAVCDTAIVIITVTPVNDKPIAIDDNAATQTNTPVVVTVLINDSDPDLTNNSPEGNILTVSTPVGILQPSNGTVSVNSNGTITYIPNLGSTSNDTFEYVICDNGIPTLCDTAKVFVVMGVVSPIANYDVDTTNEDTPVTIAINANDSSSVSSTVNSILKGTINGIVTISGNNAIYTPNPNFNGVDTFIYTYCISNSSLCDTAIVFIHVLSVNDPILAVNDTVNGVLGAPVTTQNVTLNDIDVDGPGATVTVNSGIAQPINGTIVNNNNGTFTWTANSGFTGSGLVDSFQYIVCDGGTPSYCDTAWVFINIPKCALVAEAGIYQTICIGNSIAIGGSPATAIGGSGSYSYTWVSTNILDSVLPVANPKVTPNVTALYTVTVADSITGCTATDTVSVIVRPIPVVSFTLNDSIYCSNSSTVILKGSPSGGSFAGSGVVHIGNDYFFSPDAALVDTPLTITYIYSDNGCIYSVAQSVIVHSAPKANAGLDATVCPVIGNFTTQLNATGGTSYKWTPSTGLNIDTIPNPIASPIATTTYFVAVTLNGCTSIDTVVVNVCSDTIPTIIANPDFSVTSINTSTTIHVVGNDNSTLDITNQISVSITNNPNHGVATVDAGHNINYTPATGYIGLDTLVYTLCDTLVTQAYCDTAIVIIAIRPKANVDTIGTDSIPVKCDGINANVIGNDNVGSNYDVTIQIITQPSHGDAVVLGNLINYKPKQEYEGLDTLTYAITVNGLSDTTTVIFKAKCPKDPCVFPEGFSPNGDGVNDNYIIVDCNIINTKSEMLIFNRWGNEVYHKQNGYNGEWDGKYNSQDLPDGTYYYIFKYNDGINQPKSGFIVIQR